MKFVLFYHSLVSDWNHGNAHFLRGVVSELLNRGHRVEVYEPAGGWSLKSLLAEQGTEAIAAFRHHYPELTSHFYTSESLDLERALDGADVVIVHEWNEPELIARVGKHAATASYRLFFHDTHHRSVTEPASMAALDLRHYDGVLAFGRTIAERYMQNGWAQFAWIWHEAADARRFHPLPGVAKQGDLVWIGNWGDDERTAELQEFLIDPVKDLGLKARIHGVRYPESAKAALREAGIDYAGWIANYRAPEVFAEYRCTVHVPRRAYADTLIGIPTIRMFEALACGIPLVSAPWHDAEKLFTPGEDYLVARDGIEMRQHLRDLVADEDLAQSLAARGLKTILQRHTCKHRVDELLQILTGLNRGSREIERLHASGG
ncbi:MAG TPA: glycosyltransferase [Steroidobacteraceae bacterium]|nr:glycosyltransferase [Steroidobacteraceae bacterium]